MPPQKSGLHELAAGGRRIRTRGPTEKETASCSGSSQLDPPSASSVCTARFTTLSTFKATSSPDPPCGYSEPKLLQSGATRSQARRMVRLGSRCVLHGVAAKAPGGFAWRVPHSGIALARTLGYAARKNIWGRGRQRHRHARERQPWIGPEPHFGRRRKSSQDVHAYLPRKAQKLTVVAASQSRDAPPHARALTSSTVFCGSGRRS